MALNLNKCLFAGHLTRDPSVRSFGTKTVANFSIAINRRFKTAEGEVREEVTYIDCDVWNKLADLVAQYLHKGSAVMVEGHMALDQWEDKDGKKASKLKLRAHEVQFLDNRKRSDDEGSPAVAGGAATSAATGAPAPLTSKPTVARSDDEPPF